MSKVIPTQLLASEIAQATGTGQDSAELFVKELFALIKSTLAENKSIDIKGIGRFSIIDGEARYMADAELADAVNAPFAAFEPTVIPDGFDIESLNAIAESASTAQTAANPTEEQEMPISEEPTSEPTAITNSSEAAEQQHSSPEIVSKPEVTTVPTADNNDEAPSYKNETCTDDDEVRQIQPYYPEPNRSFWWKYAAVALVAFAAGYFSSGLLSSDKSAPVALSDYMPQLDEDATATDDITSDENPIAVISTDETSDSSAADEAPAIATTPTIVTDTIRTGRFLTRIARQHYGLMDFWVYIYRENADKLGNPNTIAPGTIVVIPPAEKYGIDPDNPESVDKAKKIADEIYKPYRN